MKGAWITTAATVEQMCIGPTAAWLGLVFGPRRVLMVSASVFGVASALIPFSPSLTWVLVGQVVAGLSSGTFIPLTIWPMAGAWLISLVFFTIRHLRPADAMTFGVVLQTARLLGGDEGTAFMQTYLRVRKQLDSNRWGGT